MTTPCQTPRVVLLPKLKKKINNKIFLKEKDERQYLCKSKYKRNILFQVFKRVTEQRPPHVILIRSSSMSFPLPNFTPCSMPYGFENMHGLCSCTLFVTVAGVS